MATKLAIIAALEREVSSFVKAWKMREREFSGQQFRFFESEQAVLVCGGIGAKSAAHATEAVIALYSPALILSAGYAGAVDRSLRVGEVLRPSRVIDAKGAAVADIPGAPRAILMSDVTIADAAQKARLSSAYGAVAVDMEAAAVARVAQARGIAFCALKVISDEHDAKLPKMERFVATNGRFRTAAFTLHVAMRPWLWGSVMQLAKNSAKASEILARELGKFVAQMGAAPESYESDICPDKIGNSEQLMHPKVTSQTMEVVRK